MPEFYCICCCFHTGLFFWPTFCSHNVITAVTAQGCSCPSFNVSSMQVTPHSAPASLGCCTIFFSNLKRCFFYPVQQSTSLSLAFSVLGWQNSCTSTCRIPLKWRRYDYRGRLLLLLLSVVWTSARTAEGKQKSKCRKDTEVVKGFRQATCGGGATSASSYL